MSKEAYWFGLPTTTKDKFKRLKAPAVELHDGSIISRFTIHLCEWTSFARDHIYIPIPLTEFTLEAKQGKQNQVKLEEQELFSNEIIFPNNLEQENQEAKGAVNMISITKKFP